MLSSDLSWSISSFSPHSSASSVSPILFTKSLHAPLSTSACSLLTSSSKAFT
uniref:Uncharacterized protein n=1 Tax=Rhizophora mucronata TaxID=61149 RepID=A0A2P2P565_RHIMU